MSRPRTTNKHLPKYVTVIHGAYWFRAPKQRPVRICETGNDQALWKFMLARAEPSGPIVTMADLFDRFVKEVVPELAARTQVEYHRMIRKLRLVYGHMRPADVEPRDVGALLADQNLGRISANKHVAVLSTVFSKAMGKWYVDGVTRNPCFKVERNQKKKRDRYITDQEFEAFRSICGPRIQIAMDLALLTYQRQGDLLDLKWENVWPEGIRFRQGKTGKRLFVKMSPRLEAVLVRSKAMAPQLPREYVVKRQNGRRYTRDGFRAMWQRHMRQYVKSGGTRFTFHDIRAKAVSDSETLQKAFEGAGHSDMAMTRGTYDRGERKVEPLR